MASLMCLRNKMYSWCHSKHQISEIISYLIKILIFRHRWKLELHAWAKNWMNQCFLCWMSLWTEVMRWNENPDILFRGHDSRSWFEPVAISPCKRRHSLLLTTLPLYHSGSSVRRWPEAPWAQFCIRCRGAQTRWAHWRWRRESWLEQISPPHPLSHCPPLAGTAHCHCQRCISGHGFSCNSNSYFSLIS